jgi:hypothetical protein
MNVIDRLILAVTPSRQDHTFSILKAHLLVEEMLTTFLEQQLPHASYLDGARLTFAQKLAIARSVSRVPQAPSWDIADKLNTLRNELAHKGTTERAEKLIKEFHADAVRHCPLPMAVRSEEREQAKAEGKHLYTMVDMALVAVCAQLEGTMKLTAGTEQPESR